MIAITDALEKAWRGVDPARFFLVVSLILSLVYTCNLPYFRFMPHEKGRFLHSVHLALSVMGQPDTVPASFIDVLGQIYSPNEPNYTMAANGCRWSPQLNAKYCHPFPAGYQSPSFKQLAAIPLNPQDTVSFQSFIFAAQFSFVGYVFYALGAGLGIILGLPPIVIMYLSVGTNALAALILGYFTLKIMPVARWATCYLLLLPCAFMVRALVMPDAITIELCLLTIACGLHLFYFPRLLTKKEMGALVLLAFLTGLVKFAYFLVPFMYLIIPASCFGNKRLKYAVITIALLAGIGAGAYWAYYITKTYYSFEIVSANPALDAPFEKKFKNLFSQPFKSLGIVFSTLLQPSWSFSIMDNLANKKNHSDILIAMLPLALLTLLAERPERRKDIFLRAVAFAVFTATVLVLCMVMYFHREWSLSATPYLVQGRYLLPVIPCLLLTVHSVLRFPSNMHGWVRMEAIWLMAVWLVWVHWFQLKLFFFSL